MTDQVKKTGPARYHEAKADAKALGIDTKDMNLSQLEAAIIAALPKEQAPDTKEPEEKGPTGITPAQAKSIEAKMRYEDEIREKIREDRQIATDRAEIIAESESLSIPIDLAENPTKLELARARRSLGLKKKEVKPSPETLGIEAGKRGYYIFNNLEQEDASHTVNPGGKYTIHLIPEQIHVLSDFHIKLFAKNAVRPIYTRIKTGIEADPDVNGGQLMEKCQRTSSKRRFAFEYLGPAPQESSFGLVTDAKILNELTVTI